MKILSRTDHWFSLKTLIWIDGIAALTSGLLVLILKPIVAPILNLPEDLLSTLCMISFGYACYSLFLATRKSNPKRRLVVLVLGNSLYALACILLAIVFYKTATLLGTGYLLLEASFVAALAILEWRKIRFQ